MRIMHYLKERNLSPEIGIILGVSGGFTRDSFTKFNGESAQLIKMSVNEFDELYDQADASNLSAKKQIDVLTKLWIEKTGYWRRGLYGEEFQPIVRRSKLQSQSAPRKGD